MLVQNVVVIMIISMYSEQSELIATFSAGTGNLKCRWSDKAYGHMYST